MRWTIVAAIAWLMLWFIPRRNLRLAGLATLALVVLVGIG